MTSSVWIGPSGASGSPRETRGSRPTGIRQPSDHKPKGVIDNDYRVHVRLLDISGVAVVPRQRRGGEGVGQGSECPDKRLRNLKIEYHWGWSDLGRSRKPSSNAAKATYGAPGRAGTRDGAHRRAPRLTDRLHLRLPSGVGPRTADPLHRPTAVGSTRSPCRQRNSHGTWDRDHGTDSRLHRFSRWLRLGAGCSRSWGGI